MRLSKLTSLILFSALTLGVEPCEEPVEPHDDDLGYTCDLSLDAAPSFPFVTERSFKALPTSNGYVSATYAIDLYGVPITQLDGTPGTQDVAHRLHTFTDHVMAQPTPETHTRDMLHDLYFGLRVDGTGTWLSDVAEAEAGYVTGTGIIRLLQRVNDVEVETFIFAPFQGESYALVALSHVTNTGASSRDIDLYSLINAHAGGEGSADGEEVVSTGGGGVLETRGQDRLLYQPIEMPSHRGAAPGGAGDNPWVLLNQGQDLADQLSRGDDVAVGFQWDLGGGTLGAGEDAWGGVVLGLDVPGAGAQALVERLQGFVGGRSSEDVLGAEVDFWDAYHSEEIIQGDLGPDDLAVYQQSTAVLKMGQVREPGPGFGQLLASLPPGGWNISWPRDAAYGIVGLVKSGHLTEARDALSFMINGQAGEYADLLGVTDYLISACRYYGDGTEESDLAFCEDGRDAGPNVELDDFGLFLWAYGEYMDASGDLDFLEVTLAPVLAGVADPLLQLTEPDTNLLVPDSSIWERHWEECFPNGRKHFTYSNIMAVAGLRSIARLSNDYRYDEAADVIRSGILNMETGPAFEVQLKGQACPALASAPEEICDFCGPWDGSVIEAINLGVIRPDSALARGTLFGLMSNLSMGASPGFLRNDDGAGTTNPYPWYDDQEWVVIDLRMAAAMAKVAGAMEDQTLRNNAFTVVGWITHLAGNNANLIPELLSDGVYTPEDDMDHTNPGRDDGYEYQGSAPMTGFGPGAYILAQEALYAESSSVEPGVVPGLTK